MPELVTKYPELALKELKDANVPCGTGASQKILVTCPKDRFCALPTGELCIYGIKEVPRMTQITSLDLFLFPSFAVPIVALMIMVFLIGVVFGLRVIKR